MNAAQRKQIEDEVAKGVAIAECFGAISDGKTVDIAVSFAAPCDDGNGVKRWVGDVLESLRALAVFLATLYADGGRAHDIEILSDGKTIVKMTGEQWEKCVGVGQ